MSKSRDRHESMQCAWKKKKVVELFEKPGSGHLTISGGIVPLPFFLSLGLGLGWTRIRTLYVMV